MSLNLPHPQLKLPSPNDAIRVEPKAPEKTQDSKGLPLGVVEKNGVHYFSDHKGGFVNLDQNGNIQKFAHVGDEMVKIMPLPVVTAALPTEQSFQLLNNAPPKISLIAAGEAPDPNKNVFGGEVQNNTPGTIPLNVQDLKLVGAMFGNTLPANTSNALTELYKNLGFNPSKMFGNPSNGYSVLDQLAIAFPLFNATNAGTMLEQKTAFITVGVKGIDYLIASQTAAIRKHEQLHRSGLIDDQQYRLVLAKHETEIRRLRNFLDIYSINLNNTINNNRDLQQTVDLNRFKNLLVGLKNKTNDAFTLQQLNWNTLITNSKTLGQNVQNNIQDGDRKLNDIYITTRTTFNDTIKSTYKPTAQHPTPEYSGNNARIPSAINGGEISLNDKQRSDLRNAIDPISAGQLPSLLAVDVKAGGITFLQTQGAAAEAINNMPSALARLNGMNLDDTAILKRFGVPRKALVAELEMIDRWKADPKLYASINEPAIKAPTAIDVDKAMIQAKLDVEKMTELPLEFREKITAMNQETFNAVVLTMTYQATVNQAAKGAGLIGSAFGPMGAVGAYTAAKGAVATFRSITAEFGAANVDLQQLPNIIGQVARGENLTLAMKGMYLAKFNNLLARDSLNETIRARNISLDSSSNSRNSVREAVTSFKARVTALQQQYRGPTQASYLNLDNAKFLDNLQKQNLRVDAQIAKNNIEIATGNNKNAVAAYTASLTAEKKGVFDYDLALVTKAMVKFNAEQVRFMLDHSFRDKLVKTSEGLIVSHLLINQASETIKKQLSPADADKLTLNDSRVLKLAAVLTKNEFLKQNPESVKILNANGGKNIIGQAAISIVRDGSFAFAKQYAPFNITPVPTTSAEIKKLPDAFVAWSLNGKATPRKEAPVAPQPQPKLTEPSPPKRPNKPVTPPQEPVPAPSLPARAPSPQNPKSQKNIDGNLYFSKAELIKHNTLLNLYLKNEKLNDYFLKVTASEYRNRNTKVSPENQRLVNDKLRVRFIELSTIAFAVPKSSEGSSAKCRDAAVKSLERLHTSPDIAAFLKETNGTVNAYFGR